MQFSISVDPDNVLFFMTYFIKSSNPGSNIGDFPSFKSFIFDSMMSRHVTLWPASERVAPVTKPTYPVPITETNIVLP